MKRTTLLLIIAVLLLGLAHPAQADMIIYAHTFSAGAVIPDGDLGGWSDTHLLGGLSTAPISDVNVGLNLSGGWNGDLYAYLVHNSGFAVLLNRVGRGPGNELGYDTAGMNVTLDATAVLGNIHAVSAPAGSYQPDGRNIGPLTAAANFNDSGNPTALLSSFNGLNANGNWTLYIADVSGGGVSTLTSWTLEIAAVPEPASLVEGAVAVLFLGGVIGLYRLRRAKGLA